jgi:hypothetical protein
MPGPEVAVGPLTTLVRAVWSPLLRMTGHSDEPRIEFAPLPYTPKEPEVDIAKLAATNVGYERARVTRTAGRARVRCTINGVSNDLMWDDPLGPQLYADLFEKEQRSVPLAVRCTNMLKFRGALLQAGTCYLVDPTVQTQRAPGPVLPVGPHPFEVVCYFGERDRSRRRFILFVPTDIRQRMTISPL